MGACRLDALFDAHPRLRAAWEALDELHNLYLAEDHTGATAALDRFADIHRTTKRRTSTALRRAGSVLVTCSGMTR